MFGTLRRIVSAVGAMLTAHQQKQQARYTGAPVRCTTRAQRRLDLINSVLNARNYHGFDVSRAPILKPRTKGAKSHSLKVRSNRRKAAN